MTSLHPSARGGYAAGASSYAQGRPGYPAALVDWLREDLCLGPGKIVVDLGAGTGKFVPLLMETGATLLAVEPVAAMRAKLERAYTGIEALDGTAESIPLADGSVDAIVCAQAFHWFANPTALAEIHRVLKPAGILGLVWNDRDESVAWVAALAAIMAPYRNGTPSQTTQDWKRLFPAEGFGPLRERHVTHNHAGHPEQVIVEHILSVSYIAALPTAEQSRIVERVRTVISATPDLANKEVVTFPYKTSAFSVTKTV